MSLSRKVLLLLKAMTHEMGLGCRIVSLLALYFLITPLTAFGQPTTTWTGAVDNNWNESGNWTNGIPDETVQAVFYQNGATNLNINIGGSNAVVHSLVFGGNADSNVTIARTGSVELHILSDQGVYIAPGSEGSHSLGLTTQTIRLSVAHVTPFVNDSDQVFLLNSRIARLGPSGRADILIDGSGDFQFNQLWGTTIADFTLASSFGGTFTATSNARIGNFNNVAINGGTLALDGTITDQPQNVLVTNGGTLTGSGQIGEDHETLSVNISIEDGGLFNPGRVGDIGTFEIRRNDANFQAGSTFGIDLLSPSQHDILLFSDGIDELQRDPTLNLSTAGEGVTLQVNLLDGFSGQLLDTFPIIQDFASLTGHFAGLPHGSTFTVDDRTFQIFYNPNDVVLQLIPEPGAVTLLFLSAIAFFQWRRRRA